MSETNRDRADAVIDDFESAWRARERPDVGAFLAQTSEADRPAVLRELAGLELEYRLRAGEAARVEECLGRFPALGSEPAAVLGLIALEFRVRLDCAERVTVAEYLERFPTLRDTLPAVLDPLRRGPAEVPGYEILGELGRGGMGVVYRARHLRLNRLVALKMILAGGHAGPAERDRLRAEAEAIARLHHPGVVQVYEAGECDGLPFVALELCPGGSLDRVLTAGPLPPRDAARLVEGVARGVQAAHAARVVHRDLKPANVLLGADGAPKVTDFGLAKCLDGSGQTGSGALLGTPGYMAPEQAEGRGKEAGPAADVYALGAILYECLTGRPPFQAATAMDTLRQVVADEPAAPRRLNPAVPRDLETVCLKCLRKEPGRRYAGAADLADDLTRFLGGRPILARPVGPLARGWRWCRREPALALALAGSAAVLIAATAVSTAFGLQARQDRKDADASADVARREADSARDSLARGLTAGDRLLWLAERQLLTDGTLASHWREQLQFALAELEGLIDRNSDKPEARHRNALVNLRIGETLGLLGQGQPGLARLRDAIAGFEALHDEYPDDLRYLAGLAEALDEAGNRVFFDRARPREEQKVGQAEGLALTLRSVSSWERVTRADARPEYLAGRAAAHYRLAVAYRAQADKDRARPAFQAALDWQAKAAKAQPAERRYRSDLARVSGSVTNYLYVYEQDLGAAGKACGDTIAALQGLVGEDDSDPRDEEEYHLAYQTLYVIALQRGRPADALASVRAALPVAERLARRNPRNQTAQGRVALWQHQGLTLQREPADVESWAAKAIDTLVPLVRAAEPPRYEVWVYLLDCYSRRVEALDKLQRYAEALRDDDHRRALVESWPKAEVRRQAEFIQFWPDVEKHRRVDFVRERHRDRTRWQMTLGRFREAAQSADAAAKLATPADAWRDRLNAAEARARDGDVSAAYGVATALERDPNFDPVRALDQLTKIYDLHSDRYAANRKRNDDRIVQLLTLALQKTGAGDTAGRMRLHELRALRHTAGGRWDAAADDWEAALNLGDAARDARAGYFRERAAHTRSNAGRPTDAVALLEPLGTDVPDGQLFSLALAWARLTAHDKLPLIVRDTAARRALALLEVKLQRKSPLVRSQLEFIDYDELWRPVRDLDAFKAWRAAVPPPAK